MSSNLLTLTRCYVAHQFAQSDQNSVKMFVQYKRVSER